MKLTFLGTGTSHGIPVIACDCPVCTSSDTRDKRLRSSVFIQDEDENILVDCGPEFRIQALNFNIKKIDTILLTHSHADHLHGIDDLRVFACLSFKDTGKKRKEKKALEIYANTNTYGDFKVRFDYLFKPVIQGGGRALVNLHHTRQFSKNKPLVKGKINIYPVTMLHGTLKTNGYIFQKGKKVFVYLTDCNMIPAASIKLIQSFGKIDHLIIDGLREKKHSTHFSFAEALSIADQIGAKNTWLTHLCHDTSHQGAQDWINTHITDYPNLAHIIKKGGTVSPAFDGLILK